MAAALVVWGTAGEGARQLSGGPSFDPAESFERAPHLSQGLVGRQACCLGVCSALPQGSPYGRGKTREPHRVAHRGAQMWSPRSLSTQTARWKRLPVGMRVPVLHMSGGGLKAISGNL